MYSTDNKLCTVDIFDKRMVNLKSLELSYSVKYSRTYFSDFIFKDYSHYIHAETEVYNFKLGV